VDRCLVQDNLFPALPLIPTAILGGAALPVALLLLPELGFWLWRFLPM
jgi:hypothetical protein